MVYLIKTVLILLTIQFTFFPAVFSEENIIEDNRINGCGPLKFLINHGLDEIGEGSLIPCCNRHDICYSECISKTGCDDKFQNCLTNACNKLPTLRRVLCLLDKTGMVMAVRTFGKKFYCTKKIN